MVTGEERFGAILFKKDSLSGEAITDKGKRSGARFVTGVFGHRDFSGYASDGAKESYIWPRARWTRSEEGFSSSSRFLQSSLNSSSAKKRRRKRERERGRGRGKKEARRNELARCLK